MDRGQIQPTLEGGVAESPLPGPWTRELVVGVVKYEEEISLLREAGLTIHRLKDILLEMTAKPGVVRAAAGADLYDLMLLRK